MENISSINELHLAIRALENKQSLEWKNLKSELLKTAEELKPLNLLKKTIKDAVSSEDVKESLLVSAVSLATGFAGKALVVGQSTSPIKRFLGTLVQLSISKLVAKHPQAVNQVVENVTAFMQDKSENKNTDHGDGKH